MVSSSRGSRLDPLANQQRSTNRSLPPPTAGSFSRSHAIRATSLTLSMWPQPFTGWQKTSLRKHSWSWSILAFAASWCFWTATSATCSRSSWPTSCGPLARLSSSLGMRCWSGWLQQHMKRQPASTLRTYPTLCGRLPGLNSIQAQHCWKSLLAAFGAICRSLRLKISQICCGRLRGCHTHLERHSWMLLHSSALHG